MPAGPPSAPTRERAPDPPRRGLAHRAAWAILGALLAATLAGAAVLDRRDWPGLVGDEAAYLMQAESLAFDLDVRYSRADFDRFAARWQRPPEGLILQSGDRGETLTYGKPALYSAYLAPFVRVSPGRGPAIANALLLALAAMASARTLGRALGAAAPAWVAVFVFGSVAFGNVFWAHADLFLMSLTALGLALVHGGTDAASEGRRPLVPWAAGRWAAAGALLAAVVLSRPLYAPLLLPAAWAALGLPRGRRGRALGALAAGVLAFAAVSIAASAVQRGSWTPYGGERMGFYSHTGFPEVDLPAGGWSAELARRPGSGSWVASEKLRVPARPKVWAWDALYLLAGSHVGLLPYYLPAFLGLAAWRPGTRRWPLVAAAAAVAVAFVVIRPFNFYGGGAALANRYFLPAFPALWFLAAPRPDGSPRRGRWRWLAPAVTVLLAAPFLWPLWTAPLAHPLAPEGGWRYVSAAARRLLPYETTLDHLKPSGRDDFAHGELWIKPLTPSVRGQDEEGWIRLEPIGGGPLQAELLIGVTQPLRAVEVETPPGSPALRFGGVEDGSAASSPAPGGGARIYRIQPRQVARHPMWWSYGEDYHLYRLRIEAAAGPAGVRLRLTRGATP